MDPAYLLELAGDDRALVREIMGDFLKADAEDRQRLAAAVAARDATGVHRYAHRIKGAAQAIGAVEYAALAQVIEDAAATGAPQTGDLDALERMAIDLVSWQTSIA